MVRFGSRITTKRRKFVSFPYFFFSSAVSCYCRPQSRLARETLGRISYFFPFLFDSLVVFSIIFFLYVTFLASLSIFQVAFFVAVEYAAGFA